MDSNDESLSFDSYVEIECKRCRTKFGHFPYDATDMIPQYCSGTPDCQTKEYISSQIEEVKEQFREDISIACSEIFQQINFELRKSTGSINRGIFVVFEGLDRSGKTTQADYFCHYLKNKVKNCQKIHFPDRDIPSGRKIDLYLKGEIEMDDWEIHHLFAQNRKELQDHIKVLLEDGIWVVCDRYIYSGVAYSAAKGMDMKKCMEADNGIIKPDITIFLDISPEVCSKRSNFGDERYEEKEFQEKVYFYFQKLISERYRKDNLIVVEGDNFGEWDVHREVLVKLDNFLGERLELSTWNV